MTTANFEWARAEERSLARFVQLNLPDVLRLPSYINRLDLLTAKGPAGLAAQLYDVLRSQEIHYDLAPFDPRVGVTQLIRTPDTMLAEKRGTCLDLAVLFASLCLKYDLLPLLIVVDGHAFAGISRTRTRQDIKKPPKPFAFNRGMLQDLGTLQGLTKQEYLPVECTGFAQNTGSLPDRFPEGRGRGSSGYMSFERACDAGLEQLLQQTRAAADPAAQDKRTFLYALDIHDIQVNHGIEPHEEDRAMSDTQSKSDGRSIDTGGGAYVGGGVNTGGGDFTGRDRIVHGDEVRGDQISVGNITGSQGVAIGRKARASVTGSPIGGEAKIDAQQLRAALEELWQALDQAPLPPQYKRSATTAASTAIDSVTDEHVKADTIVQNVQKIGETLKQANTVVEQGSSLWQSLQKLAPLLGPLVGGARVVAGWFGISF